MAQEDEDIARFAVGVRVYKKPSGEVYYRLDWGNEGVPIEVVIAQLRVFLRLQEDRYFDNFKNNYSEFAGPGAK